MRITVNKDEISDVLSQVQGLTGRKTSLAITENILIKTRDNGIVISATDFETGFEGFYPAQVETEGEITVNARKLNEIVKNFPTSDIHIQEMENRWVEIACDKLEYHLVGMDPEEYPNIPQIEDARYFTMNSYALKKMIDKMVVVSVSGDEKRAHMIGVNFERIDQDGEKRVRMAATDIKRLAKIDYLCDPKSNLTAGESVIIPKKGLAEVNKFMETEGDVKVAIEGNHFIVKKENETILVNLLEGTFPDYSELLHQDTEFDIEFDRELLVMMLKRMSILTSEEYRGVVFHFENNELLMRTVNAALGESKESLQIDFDRTPLEVAFNPRYFIEAINFIESDKVLLNLRDDESPCFVRGTDGSSYLNVIMPMKI